MRTFLALDIDDAIRRKLTDARLQVETGELKIRWVAPANIHVTLNFLGEVADSLLAPVCAAAAAVAATVAPFDFEVHGLHCMPPHRPRMIWAGVRDITGRMVQLQQQLAAALDELGFPQERRPFKPHITLARIKSAGNPRHLQEAVQALADVDFGLRPADELVTYVSTRTPAGPVYASVATASLGA